MKVLIACEFSGIVRDSFIAHGHDAMSCDLLPTERLGPHYQGDVRDILTSEFNLLIAHPPCTHLAVSGARWFKTKASEQKEAVEFFLMFANAPVKYICIENPVCIMSTIYRKPDQIIQPWQFGHPERKTTCLWLKGLPLLLKTNNVYDAMMQLPKRERERVHYEPPTINRQKNRSRTYQGIANAMAEQWG